MIKDCFCGIIDLIYPDVCILCKKPTPPSCKQEQLCPSCKNMIRKNIPPFCAKCSRPLSAPSDPHNPFCKTCQRRSLYFDQAWGTCIYDDTMRRLIHLFKYGNKTALRHLFLELMLSFLDTCNIKLNDTDFIIPVPLHTTRFRERGFNQAQTLARMLSDKFNIPLSLKYIKRARHTPNQAKLSQKERWTNIQGAFKIKYSRDICSKNILIIDDLYTTGSTASEISRLLRDAGAKKISILSLAIAPKN